MTSFKKSKAQSCLHAFQQEQSRVDYQKYVIIDSQNEDQVINMKHYECIQPIDPVLMIQTKKSVVFKSKGSTVTNFMSNLSEPERCIDNEIYSAEKQVKDLQKECELLEKMITDMIEQQSMLTVALRKRERTQSMNRQRYDSKYSKFDSRQYENLVLNSKESIETIKSNMVSIVVKDPLSIVTPLISRNMERPHKKSLQIIKTVQIKDVMKMKKGKENSVSKIKDIKTKKSTSKAKQITKNRNSICKIRSKAY